MARNNEAYSAVKKNDPSALAHALRRDARNLDSLNSKGYSMLHMCAQANLTQCAELLLRARADPNTLANDQDRQSALIIAVRFGNTEMASLLVKNRAHINAGDGKQATALHHSTALRNVPITQLLLNSRADPSARDYKGRTPISFAPPELKPLMERAAAPPAAARPGAGMYPATKVGSPEDPAAPLADFSDMVSMAPAPRRDPQDRMGRAVAALERELEDIIGLGEVKEMLTGLLKKVQIDKERAKLGVAAENRLNMIFQGNPGTGKTKMARIVAHMLHSIGILKEDKVIEVSRKDLVAEFAGQTAQKTLKKLNEATGGVLFIDEAYALKNKDKDAFGQEAVDTLVQEIENRKDKLVVIMAGYTKEMTLFLQSNSGLASRFPISIEFANYTTDELTDIAVVMVREMKYELSPEVPRDKLMEIVTLAVPKSEAAKGNARAIRNYIDAVIRRQTVRIADLRPPLTKEVLLTITREDLMSGLPDTNACTVDEVLAKLDRVVGVHNIKDFVRGLGAQISIAKKRRDMGLAADGAGTLHMIFQGNPGTGKTTIARLIAEMLRSLGVLSRGQLIECCRADLVGEHVGETAPKTLLTVERAVGGVLFLDEAYSLVSNERDGFGREALDTLMKAMEDMRDELVVILAGYPREMEQLVAANPGIRSRINHVLDFPDYSADELLAIGDVMLQSMQLELDPAARARVQQLCAEEAKGAGRQSGNGRFVRNVLERARMAQARRLCALDRSNPTRAELMLLVAEDLPDA